jgi:ligand-binding sensor domain-containing protein
VQFPLQASNSSSFPLNEYFAQTWDTRDGLPHNGINALAQSKDGYLWVATWEGLARFNGREFKVFTRGSETGLPDSAIRSLFADKDGNLLVAGARGGVSERIGKAWKSSATAKALVISAIYDNHQGIWLGLEEKGLIYRDLNSQKDITVIDDLRVTQITQDHDNNLWVATSKGLYRVRNQNEVMQFGSSVGLPDSPVFSVMVSRENILYVGTRAGVFRLENNRFVELNSQLKNESVMALLQDSNDDIWIGTTNHGVYRYSNKGIEKLDDNIGLPSNHIFSIFEDQEKSIWIGTSSGLLRLRKAPFITLTSKQG